jgi:hypothetical protein
MAVEEGFRKKQNNGSQPRRRIWQEKCPESDAVIPDGLSDRKVQR